MRSRGTCFQMVELMSALVWESLCNPCLGRESGKVALREEANETRSALHAYTPWLQAASRQVLTLEEKCSLDIWICPKIIPSNASSALFIGAEIAGKVDHILTERLEILPSVQTSWSNSHPVSERLPHLCLRMLVCAAGTPVSWGACQSWTVIALGWQPWCHGNTENVRFWWDLMTASFLDELIIFTTKDLWGGVSTSLTDSLGFFMTRLRLK